MSLIVEAAHFAAEKHEYQKRKYSGDPYIYHPGRVASFISTKEWATEDDVATGWLHDNEKAKVKRGDFAIIRSKKNNG